MSDQTFPLDTISKLLDLTPQRVTQLVNEGVIPRKERGRYELVPVVRGYIKYLRERGLRADVSGRRLQHAPHAIDQSQSRYGGDGKSADRRAA